VQSVDRVAKFDLCTFLVSAYKQDTHWFLKVLGTLKLQIQAFIVLENEGGP